MVMDTSSARHIGSQARELLDAGQPEAAFDLIEPLLSQRIAFRLLDVIARQVGGAEFIQLDPFLDLVAGGRSIDGWALIGTSLRSHLADDMPGAMKRCQDYIILGDVWYACDSLGERLPGPALVEFLDPALLVLEAWRVDKNYWVRRAVGVAVHWWAKRAHGDPAKLDSASQLLSLLAPMLDERHPDAAGGVGWGLKTLGRYYPDLLADWLAGELVIKGQPARAVVLRKAIKYLPPDLRWRVLGEQE